MQIEADQGVADRQAGLVVNDQPEAAHPGATCRIFVGRDGTGTAQVMPKDARGMTRPELEVEPSGKPAIVFFDVMGHRQKIIG